MKENNINWIKTVKLLKNGYLVNGSMSVPKVEGNRHYKEIKAWLKSNTPEPEFTDKDLNKTRITNIKAKAREIIESKYPIFWQLNHPRMDSAFANDYAWIDNIRTISNNAESKGTLPDDIDWGI